MCDPPELYLDEGNGAAMKEHLTAKVLKAMPTPPPGKRTRVYDVGVTGFAAVKLPSGAIHFTLDYGPRQHRRRVLLGARSRTFPLAKAREKAKRLIGEISQGGDPVAGRAAKRLEMTFAEWKEAYLAMVKDRKKSWADDKRYLGRASEWWGHLRLSQITVEMVERAFQETKASRGRISANRFLASVRASLQAAWRLGKVVENVAAKVSFLPENPPRARVLDAKEFGAVLQAIAELEDPWERAAITLIVETGCRKSEVLHARWADLDLDAGTWRIPSPKAGTPQTVPLAYGTAAMLNNLARLGEWVVPGRRKGTRRADLRTVWSRVRESAGVEDVTIHDLRRTFGLEAARTAGLHVASRLLRHSRVSVTERVYTPLGIDELRKATEKVARKRAKVLPMRGGRPRE